MRPPNGRPRGALTLRDVVRALGLHRLVAAVLALGPVQRLRRRVAKIVHVLLVIAYVYIVVLIARTIGYFFFDWGR